jgi:hypothetical protein
MSPLFERDEIAALEIATSLSDGFGIAGLWFFLQLRYQNASSGVLHRLWQLAEPIDGIFKQFGHRTEVYHGESAALITRGSQNRYCTKPLRGRGRE